MATDSKQNKISSNMTEKSLPASSAMTDSMTTSLIVPSSMTSSSTAGVGASPGPSNPLSKKLSKILETRLDNDKDTLEALKSLSTFFGENNIRTRRNLRGDIERRSLAINEEFVDSFRVVKEQLDSIYRDVESMNECCQDMTLRLKNAKSQTHDLISQTTKLQAESQKLQLRAVVADAFLSKFQLATEEQQVLRGTRDGVLQPEFFSALARVKQIHSDCKVLLRTNQQTAGLEIMESMALQQESAYERLYRWTQNECCLLTSDSPDVSTKLCQAMEALQDRPVLFKYALDEFSNARRSAIVRSFIDALTRGGPGGMPRPIELHSHDPLRYLGDMLAWVHQGSASEKEHAQVLLKLCKKIDVDEHVRESLKHMTDGLCRSLKMRVEQVVMSEPGPVVLYKISNLIRFYQATVGQILCAEAPLVQTLEELHTLSLRLFFNSLTFNANSLLDKVEPPPSDLGPIPSLSRTLQLLRDILSCSDSSVGAPDERRMAFTQILQSMIDPLVQMCSVSASRLSAVDMATYMMNCLHLIQSTVALFEYTDQRVEMLQAQMDAHIDTLVSEQASYILANTSLSPIYNIVQQHSSHQEVLASIPGLDPSSIRTAMERFDSYLGSPDSLLLPQISLLLATKLRDVVKKRSVELICVAYGQIYAVLLLQSSGYPDVKSIAPRTPEQVANLLS